MKSFFVGLLLGVLATYYSCSPNFLPTNIRSESDRCSKRHVFVIEQEDSYELGRLFSCNDDAILTFPSEEATNEASKAMFKEMEKQLHLISKNLLTNK